MPADLPARPRASPRKPDETPLPPELCARLRVLGGSVLALLIVLGVALAYWQLVRSREFAEQGRRQTLRRELVPVARGVIFDRNHRVLAGNRDRRAAVLPLGLLREEIQAERQALLARPTEPTRPASSNAAVSSSATVTSVAAASLTARARAAVVERHLARINALLGRTGTFDAAALERHVASDRTAPFVLADNLTRDEHARLARALTPADPVRLRITAERTYPHANTAAHVLGRIRLERNRPRDATNLLALDVLDAVGDSGIEKQFDAHLRGTPGVATVRLDVSGFASDPPEVVESGSPGHDLVLSLDLDLQQAAERALASAASPRGAAVVIAVQTGEVLALANKPDFDLNVVSPRISTTAKQQLDADGAWLNRATQALYPPGSLFKIITASAGLRAGSLRPDGAYNCPGYADLAGHRFLCHNLDGHGRVTLRTALAQSCNVFAYHVGLAVGPEALVREARRFHLHEPTGIDLPFETTSMLVADPAWQRTSRDEAWTVGDTVNLSIGQGFLRISPLQAASMMAALARRETLTRPTVVRAVGRSASGNRPPEPLELSDANHAALIAGLEAVVESGIGRAAQVPGVRVAGKSGTAQVQHDDGRYNVAWFVAFAPVERPEIAIAVALEGDQPEVEFAGAAHAAPVVGEIAGSYFDHAPQR